MHCGASLSKRQLFMLHHTQKRVWLGWAGFTLTCLCKVVFCLMWSLLLFKLCNKGLYIILQMDWKRTHRPITKYTFPFLQSSLRVKISRAARRYKGCLETPTVVDLTTGSASVRASTVDYSRSTMYWKPFLGWVCFWVRFMSEKVQYGYISCHGNTLCWISSESEALTGLYTAWVVSPNLALLGAQYYWAGGTLGAQLRPLSVKDLLDKMDTFCAG